MSRTLLVATFGLFAVLAIFAAPVPKPKEKVEPGELWEFPDLKSKGWVELKDGLKVWEVKEGSGDAVKAGATVKIHYTGWLTDGKEFDSSKKNGREPLHMSLTSLIKGFQEGIPDMKPGGIRRLSIPPELAYGKKGAGGAVPPDATLVFVIELVDDKSK